MSVKRLTPNKIANLVMADDAWHDSEYVAAADYDAAVARIAELEAAKDGAYLERNQCVALIARMATALGYWAGKAKTAIDGWSEDWHGCVYIDLSAGQVSWHYHDSQSHLFGWLPPYCGDWDGHDTPEKYRRVLNRALMPNARAERAEAELVTAKADAERMEWLAANKYSISYEPTPDDELGDGIEIVLFPMFPHMQKHVQAGSDLRKAIDAARGAA